MTATATGVAPDAMEVLYRQLVFRGVELRFAPTGELQIRDVEGRIEPGERELLRANARFLSEWLLNTGGQIDAVRDPSVVRCDRCGCVRFQDITIHKGQSLRRDCVRCGRSAGFSRWYGVDTPELAPFDLSEKASPSPMEAPRPPP